MDIEELKRFVIEEHTDRMSMITHHTKSLARCRAEAKILEHLLEILESYKDWVLEDKDKPV